MPVSPLLGRPPWHRGPHVFPRALLRELDLLPREDLFTNGGTFFQQTVAIKFINTDNLVRPGKADMFSRSQSHRGRSQKPFSLGRIRGGNEADEAD